MMTLVLVKLAATCAFGALMALAAFAVTEKRWLGHVPPVLLTMACVLMVAAVWSADLPK